MTITGLILLLFTSYIIFSVNKYHQHKAELLRGFEHRIHVNGIRGKSTVTRLIAASLREGKIKTIGKTTGTSARVILNHRKEIIIPRIEADIAEQKKIIDQYRKRGYQAAVFECMAINPIYQQYLEDKVMQSTIGVITNVREDHVDMLGSSLAEIAHSLCRTIPRNGHLVTAETDETLLSILRKDCRSKNTVLHAVGTMRIGEKQMAKFKHFEYKANVAIAVKVAQLVGVKRSVALSGMHKAMSDPGSFVLKKITRKNKTVHWANLFSINDRESFVLTSDILCTKVRASAKRVVILNNRHDRPERVDQFVDIALNNVKADYIVTFGDYEKKVLRVVRSHPRGADVKVIHMGNDSSYKDYSGRQLFKSIVSSVDENEFVLFGAANIHTPQALELLGVLERRYVAAA